MIESIITYLNERLSTLNLIGNILCLCEKITKEDITYPAQYFGNGQYKSVANFDKTDGISYWLKDGNERRAINDNNQIGCERLYDINIPLKLIAVARKERFKDDEYSNDRLANILSKELAVNSVALKLLIKAKKVLITVDGKNTDRSSILQDQFQGVDFKLPYEYSIVDISINVLVAISNNCIYNECE